MIENSMEARTMAKLVNQRYQEYFMGPVTVVKEVEIIEEYKDYSFLARVDGVVKKMRLSPCGGEIVLKPSWSGMEKLVNQREGAFG
jgi:hypothetical protein